MLVEVIGGRHDGRRCEVLDGTQTIEVPVPAELNPGSPPISTDSFRVVTYRIRGHPYFSGDSTMGAVYAPIYWFEEKAADG